MEKNDYYHSKNIQKKRKNSPSSTLFNIRLGRIKKLLEIITKKVSLVRLLPYLAMIYPRITQPTGLEGPFPVQKTIVSP